MGENYLKNLTYDQTLSRIVHPGKQIIKGLNFDSLVKLNHYEDCPIKMEITTHNLFNLENQNYFLRISNKSLLSPFNFFNESSLYVRDIFVQNLGFEINNNMYSMIIEKIKVNIINSNVIPNVSRNNLNSTDEKEITLGIYQAICFGLVDYFSSDKIKQDTLIAYLKEYHGAPSAFLKEKYKDLLT